MDDGNILICSNMMLGGKVSLCSWGYSFFKGDYCIWNVDSYKNGINLFRSRDFYRRVISRKYYENVREDW